MARVGDTRHFIPNAGQNVKEVILRKNVNVYSMAKAIGMSPCTIYDFMNYGQDISTFRFAKICSYLDLSMDEVMGIERA